MDDHVTPEILPDTARLASGPPGTVVFERSVRGLGEVSIAVLDPDADLDVLHDWVQQPWARFWGLGDLTRAELRELYAYVGALPTHHAFLMRRDGDPVALVQTYQPEHDPVGALYEPRPGDVGLHFFLGGRGGAPVAGLTTRVLHVLSEFLFTSPAAERLVVEPDVRNDRAISLMTRMGFTLGPEIVLETKTARLAFLDRANAPALPPVTRIDLPGA